MRQRTCFWPVSALLAAAVASGAQAQAVESTSVAQTSPVGISGDNSNGENSLPRAVAEAQKSGTAVDPRVVASDNTFGLDLFKTLAKGATGNQAISPLSVAMALQIAYNGAAGTTQRSMEKALQLGTLTAAQINNGNAALQASLDGADPQVRLTIANSLWMHLHDNPILASFTQVVETYYGSTVGDLSGAPANVNAWVARATGGLIRRILPPEPAHYYAKVTAIIANAVYFRGRWSHAFDPRSTVSAPFTRSDGTKTPSRMMHQIGDYDYYLGADFQALRIPYGRGRLSLLIVLPNSGVGLRTLIAKLTAADLDSWISQLHSSFGRIALPRFTSNYGVSLPKPLTSLGMGTAFCASRAADFSGIARGYCLSDIEHKVVVKVDETGTVAAAATGVQFHTTLARAPQFEMTMDHPFFYVIRDDMTKELLFVGELARPN
jgi:serine protease inhibitor